MYQAFVLSNKSVKRTEIGSDSTALALASTAEEQHEIKYWLGAKRFQPCWASSCNVAKALSEICHFEIVVVEESSHQWLAHRTNLKLQL